jgi:predicted dehydrogenase
VGLCDRMLTECKSGKNGLRIVTLKVTVIVAPSSINEKEKLIKVAIVGAGKMGHIHAGAFKSMRGSKVVACCDVDLKKSREFAREFDIENYYSDIEDLINREDFNAAVIVTPNVTHSQIIEKLLTKKVAILCEKPLSYNYQDAYALAKIAEKHKIVNMVNFVHRGSPELYKAAELVRDGAIGRVMHVEASYLQSWMTSDYWGDWKTTDSFLWRLSPDHAGHGVLTDIGPVLLDMVSQVAGDVKSLRTDARSFSKGVRGNKIQGYSLDSTDSAVISADFVSGAMGAIHMTRWATGQMNSLRLRVYGDEGGLTLDIDEQGNQLQLCNGDDRHKAKWRRVKVEKTPTLWQQFAEAVREQKLNAEPSFRHAASLQKLLESSLQS